MRMDENKKIKKKSLFLTILKKIKISQILIVVVLLAVNTYAWFIYANTVSNSVDVHVKSWKIGLDDGENEVIDYLDVTVDDMYPGMTTFEHSIHAYNFSEMSAQVTYKILQYYSSFYQ